MTRAYLKLCNKANLPVDALPLRSASSIAAMLASV